MKFSPETSEFLRHVEPTHKPPPLPPMPEQGIENPLRHELGWGDVADGLARVIFGYFLLLISAGLAVGLMIWFAAQVRAGKLSGPKPDIATLWFFLGGLGLVAIISLFSYGVTLFGKWKCAMYSPDRHGAKWFMFACILCLVIGPTWDVVMSTSGALSDRPAEDVSEMDSRQQLRAALTSRASFARLFGIAVSLGVSVFFVLFLRSVGRCFADEVLINMVDYYFMCWGALVAATVYLVYTVVATGTLNPLLLLGVGAGWVLCGVWYIVLIVLTRSVIVNGLHRLRNPLRAAH